MASALFTRWFQLQLFSRHPRLQLAGAAASPWAAPDPRQRVLVDFIQLHRRLAPYVVSCGAAPTPDLAPPAAAEKAGQAKSPIEDFTSFSRVGGHVAAFSFGSALWVRPAPAATTEALRTVLPPGKGWVDFWSGASYPGGETIQTPASLDLIPLFARAGTILPLATLAEPGATDGAEARAPAGDHAPVEVRIYPGANGCLALHETSAGGPPILIPFTWNDQTRELWIGPRAGIGRGDTAARPRRFEIVLVRPGRGVGLGSPERADLSVVYEGAEMRLRLPDPPARPLPPTALAARVEDGRVFFTWQEPCGGALYRLKRAVGPAGAWEDLASALPSTAFSLELPPAGAGSLMRCVVTAMNAGGESAPSAAVTVVPETRPEPPQQSRFPAVARLHQPANAARPTICAPSPSVRRLAPSVLLCTRP